MELEMVLRSRIVSILLMIVVLWQMMP